MVSSAYRWLLELLDVVGTAPPGHRRARQCPAHDDEGPSLSLAEGDDGRALIHCHAGCRLDQVLDALALSRRHLFILGPLSPAEHAAEFRVRPAFPTLQRHPHRRGPASVARGGKLEAIHDYGAFQLLRYRDKANGAKSLMWERRDGAGAWIPGLGGTPVSDLPLYFETQVRMRMAARETIIVVESESSVDALVRAGLYATTWAGGANSPNLERLTSVLGGADVLVVPDNDPAGRRCGSTVVAALTRAGGSRRPRAAGPRG